MESFENSEILAKWAIGELNEDEKHSLETRLDLSDLAIVLKEVDSWSLPTYDVSREFELLKRTRNVQISKSPKTFNLRILYYAAASTALLIGIFYFYSKITSPIQLITSTGETINHTLPSGSTIQLDAKSTASYSKRSWRKSREIELKGQAFFNVTHGSSFIVHTNDGDIKVLGTSFNVYAENDLLKVKCYSGTVEVSARNKTTSLTKNKGVEISGSGMKEISVEEKSPDWTNGFTNYNEVNLQEVVVNLQKYYDVSIDLPQQFRQLEYSGVVVHKDLKTALELVFLPMGISYTLTNDNNVIFSQN